VSLKARLRRLEAGVNWLETAGMFIRVMNLIQTSEMKQAIADCIASDPAFAARWKETGFGLELPPPKVPVVKPVPEPRPASPPEPAQPPAEERSEGAPPEKREPAPRELPVVPPPELPVEPPIEPPFNYDPPKHMQIRPVTWRPREADDCDWDDDSSMMGRCLVDYDPLADAD